ncbi:glycosyltransferase, group 1 family protein [Ancylostoma ceylanicum]|uniref:Glycosyltransferase, group 1 family protein n=1 Tax=Ancylostoma ceylanicum TaxID=53326 RepID=A0A0D6LGR4_9BILA|nr:glycosyltransferase, group 1 family protein [Ancylostoma ceylanicum]
MTASTDKNKELFSIALVSDFFCPNAGGVETHIYFLAQCLLELGHKVVVITHAYGDRRGIRYLSNGLKTFSSMAHEAMFNGWLMGIRTVFTDHSLFGFADASAILTNTLVLQYSLANVDRVICVSYTSKENTVLRGKLDPRKVFTIPNAIETRLFYPDPEQFYGNPTTIIFLGRLVCTRHPNVRFIVGGDGPKRLELEEMREKYHLHSRVTLLGTLPHNMVREVLVQGQIFINTSLTEAFCMSIVEAASCGLHVVSTRVGGVPEVLPADFISLEEPVPELLVDALSEAIRKREYRLLMDPIEKHEAVSNMYNWPDIAKRTEVVYQDAMREQTPQWRRGLKRYADQGIGFGILYITVALINMLFLIILEYFDPASKNPLANDIPRSKPASRGTAETPVDIKSTTYRECSVNHRRNFGMRLRSAAKAPLK